MHPFTFKNYNSYLEIYRKPGAASIDISFQMRTFEPNGILFYTNLSEPRQYIVGINDVPDQDFLRVSICLKDASSIYEVIFHCFSYFLMKVN